jgi:hypothetical protein
MKEGARWPLDSISKEERIAKNNEFITRGNHKSAIKYFHEYEKIVLSEVSQGWMLPLPLKYINELINGELAPVGIDDKVWSELPNGLRKTKYRLTHDQSFEASRGRSVNNRVLRDQLPPLSYGGCFSRLVHYIVDLRLRHPLVPILGGKSDFKGAYRRVSLHGDTAEMCAVIHGQFALPSLRLTFGGSPCPNIFCLFSELCADLANDLLHCKEWDPSILCSPHSSKLSKPSLLDDSIPFALALPLDIELEPDDDGKVDIFIDDGIAIMPDLHQNRFRAIQSMLLAIHVMCRPLDHNEPLSREDCLSLSKLMEEGSLSESFTILGWDINTRNLTMALPANKYKRWVNDLHLIISRKKVSFALLKSMVGRLNHAAAACPIMRYFLSRIRLVFTNWDVTRKTKRVERYLSSQVLEDLKLWKDVFLPVISRGISLNLITYRRPSFTGVHHLYVGRPLGMGGLDIFGNAWRLPIPPEFHEAVKNRNNSLEFLASIITIWQSLLTHTARA